jgi:3'-phosphoadenosine 5'-phosphosulfate sulfotransferase (PAPS reductase)/FAD synthetase
LLNWWIIQQQNDGLKLGEDAIIALGERAGESPRRAKKQELWPRPKCQRRAYQVWNWLPVHEWSRRDIFRRIRDWGLAPHPAYRAQGMTDHEMYDIDEEGGPRTGCRFCFYASQSDICHQIERDANRALWQRMLHVERVTGKHWWPSWSAIDVETGKIKLEPRQPLVAEQLSLF